MDSAEASRPVRQRPGQSRHRRHHRHRRRVASCFRRAVTTLDDPRDGRPDSSVIYNTRSLTLQFVETKI